MYAVVELIGSTRWQLVSRHRKIDCAQIAARRLTSAKVSRERVRHYDDVLIMWDDGDALRDLGPASFYAGVREG